MSKDKGWRKYYMIYRVYSPEEIAAHQMEYPDPLFKGWTDDKNMVKSYFIQRDPDKYEVYVQELEDEEAENRPTLNDKMKLDVLMLNSKHSKEMVPLITTALEVEESRKSIYHLFARQSIIPDVDDNVAISWAIYTNLPEDYKEALHVIGYEQDGEALIYDRIYDPYDPGNELVPDGVLYGDMAIQFRQTIFSLESFVKVMEFDM